MYEIYMKVTNDAFRLPVAVADSVEELARMTGVRVDSLASIFSKIRHGKHSKLYEIVYMDGVRK